MNLNDFLLWLATSAGSISAVSWILERLAWFQSKASDAKQWIIFGFSVLVSVGAYATLTYIPMETLAAIAPYFAIIAGIFGTIFLGKLFHSVDRSR